MSKKDKEVFKEVLLDCATDNSEDWRMIHHHRRKKRI